MKTQSCQWTTRGRSLNLRQAHASCDVCKPATAFSTLSSLPIASVHALTPLKCNSNKLQQNASGHTSTRFRRSRFDDAGNGSFNGCAARLLLLLRSFSVSSNRQTGTHANTASHSSKSSIQRRNQCRLTVSPLSRSELRSCPRPSPLRLSIRVRAPRLAASMRLARPALRLPLTST